METEAFQGLEDTFRSGGPGAVFDSLIQRARREKNYRLLFSVRLMQTRHALGLPLIETEPVNNLPAEQLSCYEKGLREAARETGELFLSDGDIVSAWPYCKAIGEQAAIALAIENVKGGEQLERVIEIALHEGVNPRKGFGLILEHHGICRAITMFSAVRDFASRQECLRLMVRSLYGQVAAGLKETIASVEGAAPDTDRIAELMAGRPWLFEGNSYYVDSTHLTAILRFTPELEDVETLRMAVELAGYGRSLAEMFHFRGEPPFEDTYADHAVYLRALLGEDVGQAIAHFRRKAGEPESAPGDTTPAEVFIELLMRLGRYAEAVEASLEFLPNSEGIQLSCASATQLCQMAGDYRRLREVARKRGDLVGYAAAVIQSEESTG